MFVGLLTSIANAFNHINCIFLNNQQYMTQPTLINLHPNECIEGLCCYQFAVNLA